MSASLHARLSLVFVALVLVSGLVLEGLYGLRAAAFMEDELRREFLRLGHAHGGVLGLLNLACVPLFERLGTPEGWARPIRVATLLGALLVALGFGFGGIWHSATDPGLAVLLVPAGALSLASACLALAVVRHEP